jgi:hypothetical protein
MEMSKMHEPGLNLPKRIWLVHIVRGRDILAATACIDNLKWTPMVKESLEKAHCRHIGSDPWHQASPWPKS